MNNKFFNRFVMMILVVSIFIVNIITVIIFIKENERKIQKIINISKQNLMEKNLDLIKKYKQNYENFSKDIENKYAKCILDVQKLLIQKIKIGYFENCNYDIYSPKILTELDPSPFRTSLYLLTKNIQDITLNTMTYQECASRNECNIYYNKLKMSYNEYTLTKKQLETFLETL
jgi:hypothetical protein